MNFFKGLLSTVLGIFLLSISASVSAEFYGGNLSPTYYGPPPPQIIQVQTPVYISPPYSPPTVSYASTAESGKDFNGFEEILWGTTFDSVKDQFTLIETTTDEKTTLTFSKYERINDPTKTFDPGIQSVRYCFYESTLARVEIEVSGFIPSHEVMLLLGSWYGWADASHPERGYYQSYAANTFAKGSYDPSTKKATFTITGAEFSKKFAQIEKEQKKAQEKEDKKAQKK